jgi:hypothetical protein
MILRMIGGPWDGTEVVERSTDRPPPVYMFASAPLRWQSRLAAPTFMPDRAPMADLPRIERQEYRILCIVEGDPVHPLIVMYVYIDGVTVRGPYA